MNKEELIDMAKQSGAKGSSTPDEYDVLKINDRSLEALAKLLAKREREACAKEREACAKVCDVLAVHPEYASSITKLAAQAIRNRG